MFHLKFHFKDMFYSYGIGKFAAYPFLKVVSSILRNLSWRADITSKRALRDVGSVSALMTCALQATKVKQKY